MCSGSSEAACRLAEGAGGHGRPRFAGRCRAVKEVPAATSVASSRDCSSASKTSGDWDSFGAVGRRKLPSPGPYGLPATGAFFYVTTSVVTEAVLTSMWCGDPRHPRAVLPSGRIRLVHPVQGGELGQQQDGDETGGGQGESSRPLPAPAQQHQRDQGGEGACGRSPRDMGVPRVWHLRSCRCQTLVRPVRLVP